MYRHREILRNVADNLMSLIAEAGGESRDFFEDMFNPWPLHTLRTIMYPVRKNNIPDGAYLPDGRSKKIQNFIHFYIHTILFAGSQFIETFGFVIFIFMLLTFSCINPCPSRLWISDFAPNVWTAGS